MTVLCILPAQLHMPASMNTDTKQSENGCNGTSFGDHGVPKRDRILSLFCHRQA